MSVRETDPPLRPAPNENFNSSMKIENSISISWFCLEVGISDNQKCANRTKLSPSYSHDVKIFIESFALFNQTPTTVESIWSRILSKLAFDSFRSLERADVTWPSLRVGWPTSGEFLAEEEGLLVEKLWIVPIGGNRESLPEDPELLRGLTHFPLAHKGVKSLLLLFGRVGCETSKGIPPKTSAESELSSSTSSSSR